MTNSKTSSLSSSAPALATLMISSTAVLEKDPLLWIISSLASSKQLQVQVGKDAVHHHHHHHHLHGITLVLSLSNGICLEERNVILRCLCGMGLHNALDQAPYYLLGGHAKIASSHSAMAMAGIAQWQGWARDLLIRIDHHDHHLHTKLQELNVYLERHAFLVPSATATLADLDVALTIGLIFPKTSKTPQNRGEMEEEFSWKNVPHVVRWLIQCFAVVEQLALASKCLSLLTLPPCPVQLPQGQMIPHPIFFHGTEDVVVPTTPVAAAAASMKKSTTSSAGTSAIPKDKVESSQKDNKPSKADKKSNLDSSVTKDTSNSNNKNKDASKSGKVASSTKATPESSSSEFDITALDIRVGRILKVWPHEQADKLYCEEIDLGEASGPRQIASGLRPFYPTADELQGRTVLVLANLKARTLVGFASHGMVLCASNEDHTHVELVIPPEGTQIGERVMFDGYDPQRPPEPETKVAKKKILEKLAPNLQTNDQGQMVWNNAVAKTSAGIIAVTTMPNAHVS